MKSTVQDFIESNENVKIEIAQKFSRNECDPLSIVLWAGRLHDTPEEYRACEVIGAGWLTGAQYNRLEVYMGA